MLRQASPAYACRSCRTLGRTTRTMPQSSRFSVAAKGAILWVLLACLVGLVPALVNPSDAALGLPWIATGMGVAGAVAHVAVILVRVHPSRFLSTAASIAMLGSLLALSFMYALVGVPELEKPSACFSEISRAMLFVILPMVVVSAAVLRLLRGKSAA
jgi:hypothetical protein